MGIFKLRTIGQGHFDVHFVNKSESKYRDMLGFQCDLTGDKTDFKFKIHGKCYLDCCEMSGVPISTKRVWTFSTTFDSISSPTGIDVACNGVNVMSLKFSSLGDCLSAELQKVITSSFYINSDDKVTTSYMVIRE